jgi:hypothetical protein
LFIPVCAFCLFLSSLVWFFLWFIEELLTLLFLLHCENGDFSILMKDIVWSGISFGLGSGWLKLGDFTVLVGRYI